MSKKNYIDNYKKQNSFPEREINSKDLLVQSVDTTSIYEAFGENIPVLNIEIAELNNRIELIHFKNDYDTIDNSGNLLINNPEIVTLNDALYEDTLQILLKQNDLYIIGSIFISITIISAIILIK